ncbi:hypothetical protein FRB93_005731 [Tulasnella sp. JGI-2019a]|nr:hypothetical protein FRB93_005731 [Tulasnella sp. JGI-2019a]
MPCGTCTRSHAHARKLEPLTTPADFECTYDNPEEAAEAPSFKISRLQARIAELELVVQAQEAQLASCICRNAVGLVPDFQAVADTYNVPLDSQATSTLAPTIIVSPVLPSSQSPETHIGSEFGHSPSFPLFGSQISSPATSSMPEINALSTEIWPMNIPPPELLRHLVDTVLICVPLANRIIHRPTFMANLAKPTSSLDFPHVNLLHAICALASLYTPIVTDVNPSDPEAEIHEGGAAVFNAGVVNRRFNDSGPRYFPRRQEDLADLEEELDFAGVHMRWCWAGMRVAIRRGDALIQQVQACLLACWFLHSRGLVVSASAWLGNTTKILHTLGVHISPELGPLSRIPEAMLFNLNKATTNEETELRRNIFWAVYSTERIFNAFNVWPSGLEDQDCSQVLPCRSIDFEAGRFVPTQARQRILTRDALVVHPQLATDSFTLYIKAAVIMGKVKTFNRNFRYRYTDGDQAPSIFVDSNSEPHSGPANSVTTIKPQETDEFKALDNLIDTFISSIPREFKDPVGLSNGAKLDPTLYMAHMLPHMAKVALHDPHANVYSTKDPSAKKILAAAHAILELIYKVCATTYDLLYLDHSSSKAWFVAGVTLIRFLAARTAQNDEAEVAKLTQELGAVRFILGNLGDRTRIGLRQIKLLETVYDMEMAHARRGFQTTILAPATLEELSP